MTTSTKSDEVTAAGSHRSLDRLFKKSKVLPVPMKGNGEAQARFTFGILSAKGGSGATTTAINLACASALAGHRSCLIDAHLQSPDVCVLAGRQPRHSLVELLARKNELDRALVENCAITLAENLPSGCLFFSGPATGEAALEANLSEIASCLPELAEICGVCVVDLPGTLDRHLVNMLDTLDAIVVMFEATIGGVAATRRWLSVFAELGYDSGKVVLVQNRAGSKLKNIENDLERLLGQKPDFAIANRFDIVETSLLKGVPAVVAAPSDKYSRQIAELFEIICFRTEGRGQ